MSDGEPGEPGQDASDALVKMEPEPPGENCEDGGVAIHTGMDLNGNGVFDREEIEETSYVCHGSDAEIDCEVLPGSLTISNALDWMVLVLSECPVITGDLTIEGFDGEEPFSLPGVASLEHIGGALTIQGNGALVDLEVLSSLASIAGNLRIQNNDVLENLEGLNSLVAVGGDLSIGGWFSSQVNPALTSLSGLDSLAFVGEDFTIGWNVVLPECLAWELHDQIQAADGIVGDVTISDNDADAVCD